MPSSCADGCRDIRTLVGSNGPADVCEDVVVRARTWENGRSTALARTSQPTGPRGPDRDRAAPRPHRSLLAECEGLRSTAKTPRSSDERAATQAFAKHPALKGVHVRVRGGIVSFTGVPAASMSSFVKAIAAVDWGKTPNE